MPSTSPILVAPLQRGWHTVLTQLVEDTQESLLVAAPFITHEGSRLIVERLSPNVCATGRLHVVTDLSPAHVCDGSLEPAALGMLYDAVGCAALWHIPRLHAKVYVSDHRRAIVTSGNLTASGLFRNLEYGIDVRDLEVVRTIVDHFTVFQATGATVSRDQLAKYVTAASELKEEFAKLKQSASSAAKRAFCRAMREAEDELVRLRLAGGAMHTVFARTVEFLLSKHGPMSTVQIHGYVQALHPELCDDSVDRVIDGNHFGKKWKHAVRTAQQMLKKRGIVQFANGHWQLEE